MDHLAIALQNTVPADMPQSKSQSKSTMSAGYFGDYDYYPSHLSPTIERPSAEKLTQLLKDAANAHHEYESVLGRADSDWQSWYAAYIVGRL
jgi:hypothetical protein